MNTVMVKKSSLACVVPTFAFFVVPLKVRCKRPVVRAVESFQATPHGHEHFQGLAFALMDIIVKAITHQG